MASFTEHTTKCIMCGNKFKFFTGGEGVAILYHHCYIPICKTCTKKVLKVMGIKSLKDLAWVKDNGKR